MGGFTSASGFFTQHSGFDLSKAQAHLGYVSRWDNREGIARTIDWYREMKLI